VLSQLPAALFSNQHSREAQRSVKAFHSEKILMQMLETIEKTYSIPRICMIGYFAIYIQFSLDCLKKAKKCFLPTKKRIGKSS